jgi:predicted lipoprotein with Yx(FWY)xxD motif
MKKRNATAEGSTRSRPARRSAALAIGVTAMIGLAACGSSGSSTATVSPGAQPAATTAPGGVTPASSSDAIVKTAMTAKGTVLVDSSGMTLYTLKNNGTPVACTGACAAAWPPLVLPAGTTSATGADGVTGLGTVVKAGATHVTSDGAPLYRFKGDSQPDDANGDGLASFGGVWHVVTSAAVSTAPAAPAPVPAATTPTTASSSGGGGYGY